MFWGAVKSWSVEQPEFWSGRLLADPTTSTSHKFGAPLSDLSSPGSFWNSVCFSACI